MNAVTSECRLSDSRVIFQRRPCNSWPSGCNPPLPSPRARADARRSARTVGRRGAPFGRTRLSPVRFAGLVFDLSACTLVRESGEAIPLTRGEFRLLRLFVSRPGRVLSRDAILEAIANRPLELFDRSVDALVGRLRRKIEPDPKTPRLIVTVPGEGYRFDGLAPALRGAPADGATESDIQVAPNAAEAAPMAARPADPAQPNGASPPPSAAAARRRDHGASRRPPPLSSSRCSPPAPMAGGRVSRRVSWELRRRTSLQMRRVSPSSSCRSRI